MVANRATLFRSAYSVAGVLLMFSMVGCGRKHGPGTVNRMTVGDTLFVENILPEDQTASLFSFEKDLEIGIAEGEDPYMLTGVDAIAADDAGRIYISHQIDGEIRVYDQQGIFLRRFGRRGNGPGEFNSNYWGLFDVRPVSGGMLTVEDLPQLKVFDQDGGYQRSFNFWLIPSSPERTGQVEFPALWFPDYGSLVTKWRGRYTVGKGAPVRLVIVDEKMKPLKWLPPLFDMDSLFREGTVVVPIPCSPTFLWTVTGSSHFVWAISQEYRLYQYDMEEDSWTTVTLNRDPERLSNEDVNNYKERFLDRIPESSRSRLEPALNKMPYPRFKPFFSELMGDDQGHIWVLRTVMAYWLGPYDVYTYDLFDSDGIWLGIVESPRQLAFVRSDHAYASGDKEYPTIERYRMIPVKQ